MTPAAGLDATALVEIGTAASQRIVEVADERDASLIVLGSRGRSGLSYVLLGSVAAAVVQHSKRTVMVVHPAPRERPAQPAPAPAARSGLDRSGRNTGAGASPEERMERPNNPALARCLVGHRASVASSKVM